MVRSPVGLINVTLAPRAISTGGRSMWGSPCAMAPPTVATLRTRTFDSRRMARVITGATRATSAECSSAASGVIAPIVRPPSRPALMPERRPPRLPGLGKRGGVEGGGRGHRADREAAIAAGLDAGEAAADPAQADQAGRAEDARLHHQH